MMPEERTGKPGAEEARTFFRSLDYENGMETVVAILRHFPMQYGTTLGLDGHPQIRPLEFKFEENGVLYFDCVDSCESYREMKAHPYMQFCIGDRGTMTYLRVGGKVNFTNWRTVTMKAVLIDRPTKAEEICLTDVPVPEVRPGWVLVRIRAFGMNHSESILREFEIKNDYISKPVIPGIECVGEIADPSDSGLAAGQKVAALMGGMGRSFNGSYAEYALLPLHHVFPVESDLSWTDMAAIPETYFTAWGSLFRCLRLTKDDRLLVRGATCALGYVAVQLAKAVGCEVTGTTHRESKLALLEEAGCDGCVLDDGSLRGKVSGITKALELVGIKTVKDTMRSVAQGGIVCNTGVLGKVYEWNHFDPIRDIPNGVCLTGFYSNDPSPETMQDIFRFMDEHKLKPLIGAVYDFRDIREACIALDRGGVNGKIVVSLR